MEEFKKFDGGKLEYDLLPDSALQDTIKVLMFGAKKYGKDNWKSCKDNSRYYNALRRHLEAWRQGIYNDEETGLPHLSHALCNLIFIHYLEEQKQNEPKTGNTGTPDEKSGGYVSTEYAGAILPSIPNPGIKGIAGFVYKAN